MFLLGNLPNKEVFSWLMSPENEQITQEDNEIPDLNATIESGVMGIILGKIIPKSGKSINELAIIDPETGVVDIRPTKKISCKAFRLMRQACKLVICGGRHPKLGTPKNLDYDPILQALKSNDGDKRKVKRGIGRYSIPNIKKRSRKQKRRAFGKKS